jgi:hypothetical protein
VAPPSDGGRTTRGIAAKAPSGPKALRSGLPADRQFLKGYVWRFAPPMSGAKVATRLLPNVSVLLSALYAGTWIDRALWRTTKTVTSAIPHQL